MLSSLSSVLTIIKVAVGNRNTVLISLPITGTTMTTRRAATTATALPPALHLGTRQLGRGLGTCSSTGGLLGTAAAGRGSGGGGSWNFLLPLADLHCRGLSLLVLWNGWTNWKVVPAGASLSRGGGRPNVYVWVG